MPDKNELCDKIVALYPDIGSCGIDIDVVFDERNHAWAVQLSKDQHRLTHYLDVPEADACLAGKQCVALGLDIAQLRRNIDGKGF